MRRWRVARDETVRYKNDLSDAVWRVRKKGGVSIFTEKREIFN